MRKVLSALVAILTGLLVLAGYFLRETLGPVLMMLFDWALLLGGVAGLLGVGHWAAFHLRNVRQREALSFFSLVTLLSFLTAFITGLVLSPQSAFFRDLILNIQVPVEASLAGVLAVILCYASIRLIRVRGWSAMSIAFLASAMLYLVLDVVFIRGDLGSIARNLLDFLRRLPLAGARGILLGMALGGLMMGLRVLLTIDKPYDGEG
jgi:hypothetical protein